MNTLNGLIPCIISGGSGTRLWPVSRQNMPKPFMRMRDGQSLLQKTFQRAAKLPGVESVLTVTNRDLLFRTLDDYRLVNKAHLPLDLLLEPFGRNTAAAIAVAALHVQEHFGGDAQLLVMPADHLILNEVAFAEAVTQARDLAEAGYLVTFGIQPDHPETGFGYIEQGEALGTGHRVKRFVEKPDLATAQGYLDGGKHLWNAGMFCFKASALVDELAAHAPDVLDAARAALEHSQSLQNKTSRQRELDADAFGSAPDVSIDVALMEKSKQVAVVPCDIGWSDIGSWNAVSELTEADAQGNRFEGEVLSHNARNNFVHSEDRLTALVGVDDLLVIDTPDALMISHKDHCQDVKHIVGQLKANGHHLHKLHRTVHRPWGTYTTLEEGERFKIKRIVVKPQASLSLQMHHHRSEHWIVVSGMAVVVNDDRELMLNTNESTFIRAGHQHRLKNPGVIDLVLIEVQSGDYLGEDDIVRFEDVYGRVDKA